MTAPGTDWRTVEGVATAWYEASSLVEGAALVERVGHLPGISVDLRSTGARVRLDPAHPAEHGEQVSAAAHDLGLVADPAVPQRLGVVIRSADPARVRSFWPRVIAYPPAEDGRLADPWGRDPSVRIEGPHQVGPLRNRVHLDVVRPAAVVEQVGLGEGSGPFGVRHADPDGNEVDLVPGAPLDGGAGTADWQVVFGALACYRTGSTRQQIDLASAAASLAVAAGFPLLVDLRPGLVVLDSGKDQWEGDAHGLDVDFADLAADLQHVARDLGATADPHLPRFVQVFLDAADVAAVRAFWEQALGYRRDRRAGLEDLYDRRRLDPVLVFQPLEATETERRRQRNRVHVELAVPADVARSRLDAALAAGGVLLDGSEGRWLVSDPEGNELALRAG